MITAILIIDFLLNALTIYNLPLIILAIPFLKSFYPILLYFVILSLYEPKYLLNLTIIYVLYRLDKFISQRLRDTAVVYIIKIIFYSLIYVLLLRLLESL